MVDELNLCTLEGALKENRMRWSVSLEIKEGHWLGGLGFECEVFDLWKLGHWKSTQT
jgi:hypothetical protein